MRLRTIGIGTLLCCTLFVGACDYETTGSQVAVKTSRLASATAPVTVSLTFDDQRISQSVVQEALLAANELKATFYVISAFVNDAPGDPPDYHPEKLSLDQLLELERAGHEIGAHSRTHVSLPAQSSDVLSDEVCGSLRELTSYGLGTIQPIVSFAYPYGDYDETVEAEVANCGFTSARSVQAGPERIPPAGPFALRTSPKGGSITQDDSVASIEDWISSSEQGDWVQLIWHDIASPDYEPNDEYCQKLDDFKLVLQFLADEVAQGHIAVKTVAQVMAESSTGASDP